MKQTQRESKERSLPGKEEYPQLEGEEEKPRNKEAKRKEPHPPLPAEKAEERKRNEQREREGQESVEWARI